MKIYFGSHNFWDPWDMGWLGRSHDPNIGIWINDSEPGFWDSKFIVALQQYLGQILV